MGIFMIFLALRFVGCEKLDRKYLPPPGAQYAGGNPEDLQVPLELPKETPEIPSLTPVAPDNNLVRSDYYIGSNIGANVGKDIDTKSTLKSLQSPFNTSLTSPITYMPKIISETKHKKKSQSKYQGQNGEVPALASEITNAQNRDDYRYNQNNPLFNDDETTNKPVNFPKYTTKSFIPNINNYLSNIGIGPSQYAANAENMDDVKFHRNPDSLAIVPNFKPSPGNADHRSDGSSNKKSRPLTSNISSGITPSKTRYEPERPQAESDRNAIILNYQNVITPEGFSYNYDTSNGISAEVSGTADNGVRAQGAYSYTGDDGKVYKVVYTADENGFQPRGEHLPPLPTAIQRLAEKAAREKEFGIIDDGSYNEDKYGHKKYHGVMERYHPDFQGFSNNGMNQFGLYPKKLFRDVNTRRPTEMTRKLLYKNKQAVYQDEDNIPIQAYRTKEPANQGKRNNKLLNNSNTKSVDTQRFMGENTDSKVKMGSLDISQNIIKEEKSLSAFPIQQEERKQSLSKGFNLLPTEHNAKHALVPNNNIPDTTANTNTYTKMVQDLNDEPDGYFYIKPLNKFIENENHENVKFDSDQELEIGDDDIITISVPVPSTSIRPDYESSRTTSPYNKQYSTRNETILQSNFNIEQEANPEFPVVPNNTVDSTTPLSEDIYNQGKRPNHNSIADIEPIVNLTGDRPRNIEYSNISQEPQMQTLHDLNADLNMLRRGFIIPKDDNIYDKTSPKLYSENQNPVINLEKSLGINEKGSLDVNAENITIGDIRSDNSDLFKEDFKGPIQPQTLDPNTGYYY